MGPYPYLSFIILLPDIHSHVVNPAMATKRRCLDLTEVAIVRVIDRGLSKSSIAQERGIHCARLLVRDMQFIRLIIMLSDITKNGYSEMVSWGPIGSWL